MSRDRTTAQVSAATLAQRARRISNGESATVAVPVHLLAQLLQLSAQHDSTILRDVRHHLGTPVVRAVLYRPLA